MTETDPPKPTPKPGWALPSWSRIADFALNVLQLERSIESLKSKTEKLENEISRLQRQTDEQAGQIKVLLGFVETSLRDQIETKAEQAAARLFRQFVAFQESPDRDPSEPR